MKLENLIQDNGLFTLEGKQQLSILRSTIETFISQIDEEKVSEKELMTIEASIMKEVSDIFSSIKQVMRKNLSSLFQMSDEEFESYMDNKYGKDRLLISMTDEEYERTPKPSVQEMKEIMEKARKAAESYSNKHSAPIISNLRIR